MTRKPCARRIVERRMLKLEQRSKFFAHEARIDGGLGASAARAIAGNFARRRYVNKRKESVSSQRNTLQPHHLRHRLRPRERRRHSAGGGLRRWHVRHLASRNHHHHHQRQRRRQPGE